MRKNARTPIATAVVALAVLAFCAPAGAATKQKLLFSFGSLGRPNDIAIDQSNENVFVSDNVGGAVDEFKLTGPNEYTAAGQLPAGETPSGSFNFGEVEGAAVAVDSSSHAVYVADIDHGVVDEFKLNGSNEYRYVCQFTGWYGAGKEACSPSAGVVEQPFVEPDGVAVDSAGNVYISDFGHGAVDMFNASGVGVRQILNTQWSDIAAQGPGGLALNAEGDIYVQNYQSSVAALKVSGLGEVVSQSVLDEEGQSFAVGVDPGLGDVYVAHREAPLAVYDSSGVLLDTLSLPNQKLVGVAADATTHDVLVSDAEKGDIHVFGPPTVVPDVRLSGEATSVGATSATVHGEVNANATKQASYYFEYGLTTAYGSLSPELPGTSIGEGTEFVAAETELSGLQPNTTYHYRLDATNSSGLVNEGKDGAFKTSTAPPAISGIEATKITTDSVMFRGSVNPENDATSYRFEYEEESGPAHLLPLIGIGTGGAPVEVEQASPAELTPGRTYHYRLIAVNFAGEEAIGPDQEFATPAAPSVNTTPPTAFTGSTSAIGQDTATISGAVDPEGLPTTYELELGPTTDYETSIFGQAGSEVSLVAITLAVGGLQPATTYHYRIVAFNAAGVGYGEDEIFTTVGFPMGIVQPVAPSPISFVSPIVPVSAPVVKRGPAKHKVTHKCHKKAKKKKCLRKAAQKHKSTKPVPGKH